MISESEYRFGRGCPTRILHARAGLQRADDSFAAWMREESGKVRALAGLLFPGAVEVVGGTPEAAAEETKDLLSAGRQVAGAVIKTDRAWCRVDHVSVEGPVLRLHAFVPKAVDLERHRCGLEFTTQSGRVRREWREHLEVAALRVWIARQAFPQARVVPLVVVPVTRVPCPVEHLHGCFEEEADGRWVVSNRTTAESATGLLRIMSVAAECEPLVAEVEERVASLERFLEAPARPEIGYRCKKCEFRVPGRQSGFERCWGPLAHVQPHMFDLTYMYFIQEENGQPVANRLAREGHVSLWDIPRELIAGDYAARQRMQLDGTASGEEIIRPELAVAMAGAAYPLHFLDIETLRSLLPAHRGGMVNGLTLFQFSIHTRSAEDAELTHQEWLNTDPSDPNRRFLAALRRAIGDEGTVCIWTRYEEVSFRELLTELIGLGVEGEDFDWLRDFLVSGRLLDLNQLCFEHYFHPAMKGRTSIKVVLPAVWSVDSPVKARAPYHEFSVDPYTALKTEGAVGDGCAAMEAYLAMQSPERRPAMSAQLRRYCGIDTLAMAFVWDYWRWRLDGEHAQKTASLA